MSVNFNTISNAIDHIYEVYNMDYAPLCVWNCSKNRVGNLTKSVNEWFKGRGIPSWRKDLENLLMKLHLSSAEELLNKAYALSLSDQYWLKEENKNLEWKDINFFTNPFSYEGFLEASLDSSSSHISVNQNLLKSPNNTTDGMLQKGWIIENDKRVLVKGTYTSSKEEPINEWLASQISKRLGFVYCNYEVAWKASMGLVSKCENFITKDEEIISAYDVLNTEKKPNDMNDYTFYTKILEKHHVPNARKNIVDMFVVDYLLINTDRHLKNFGVIRNVNTLQWVRTTPIFDTGQSMQCEVTTENLNFYRGKGKFFTNTQKDYEQILETLGVEIKNIDCSKLDGLEDEYKHILLKYQNKIQMSDTRIEKLTNGLQIRVNQLKNKIQKL